jgi:hypothetical protein
MAQQQPIIHVRANLLPQIGWLVRTAGRLRWELGPRGDVARVQYIVLYSSGLHV